MKKNQKMKQNLTIYKFSMVKKIKNNKNKMILICLNHLELGQHQVMIMGI